WFSSAQPKSTACQESAQPGQLLREPVRLLGQQSVRRVELRPVIAAQLVERDFLETPFRQFETELRETRDRLAHQQDVRSQQWPDPAMSLFVRQGHDTSPQRAVTARPATRSIVERADAIHADRQ